MNTIKTIEQMVEAMEKFRYHLANNYEINAAIQAGRALLEELKGQEPVQWDLAEKVRQDLDRQSCPDAFMRIAVESIVKHYTHPPQSEDRGLSQPAPTDKPKAVSETHKPLTIEQLLEHWRVAKVLDMTDAEIDFADYVLIARDVEALYGIKGEA